MNMNKTLYVVSLDVLPYTVTTDIWQEWHGSLVKHQMSTNGLHHVNVLHLHDALCISTARWQAFQSFHQYGHFQLESNSHFCFKGTHMCLKCK